MVKNRDLSICNLRKICQGGEKLVMEKDYYFCRYFSRNISIYLTKFFLYFNISANFVTLLSFFSMLGGFIFLLIPGKTNLILSSLLLIFATILDCNDGEISRFTKTSSKLGGFMDSMMADYFYGFFFGILGYSIYINQDLLSNSIIFNFVSIEFFILLGFLISVFKLLERISSLKISKIKNQLNSETNVFNLSEFSLKRILFIIEMNFFSFAGMMYHLFLFSVIFNIFHLYLLVYFTFYLFSFFYRSYVHYMYLFNLENNN
jgi:phosphatidylglycerophosphate synthase